MTLRLSDEEAEALRRRRDRLRIGGIGGWMIPAPACTAIQPTLPVMGNA